MRFRPEQHLRRPNEFRTVRDCGRRIDCGAFTLWWYLRPAAESSPAHTATAQAVTARLGVVASKSAVGGAVQRNRAKRRLRALFRHQQTLVPAGCDVLLVARLAVNRLPYQELEQKFIEACRRITLPKTV